MTSSLRSTPSRSTISQTSCTSAATAYEAVDYLFGEDSTEVPPRLILLDFKMPRMNGLELLERIRAEERTKRVPVIMLTASDEEPDMARSYDLGANSYIVKPVDFRQFSEVVLQLGLYWLLLNRVPGMEAEPQAAPVTAA